MQRIGSAEVQQWIKYGKCISERLFYCVTKLILAQDDSNHLQLEQEELNILTGLKPHTLIFHFLKSQFNSTSLLSFFFFFLPNALFAITSPLNPNAENPPRCLKLVTIGCWGWNEVHFHCWEQSPPELLARLTQSNLNILPTVCAGLKCKCLLSTVT